MFASIVMLCGTIDIDLYIHIVRAVLGRITCNRDMKRIPPGVVCTSGWANKGD